MSSIIEESQKARKKIRFKFSKKNIFIFIAILLTASSAYAFFGQSEEKEVVKEDKVWSVKKDDISISIESDGKVVAEDGVELSFSVSGDNLEIEEVFVQEGDTVSKGDKIATVKTEVLELSVNSAYASYLSALADYNEVVDGATEEEIADAQDKISSAEISVAQAEISLAKTKQTADENIRQAKNNLDDNQDELSSEDVNNSYDALLDTIKATNISLSSMLRDSDEIIGVDDTDINDDFEHLLAVQNRSVLSQAENTYAHAVDYLEDLDSLVVLLDINSSHLDIDVAADQTVQTLDVFEEHLYKMKLVLDNTITSNDFSQSALDNFRNTIDNNRTSVNTKISSIDNKLDDVEDAKEGLEDYIIDYENTLADAERDIENAEASLSSKELSLEQAQRDYDELMAPLTEAEANSAQSRLTAALVSLQKAQLDLEEATITSPIDGEVAMLNYKTGDIIVDNSSSDPVAVILNSDTLFVEVDIEEADINNIEKGQTAYVTFDSLEGTKLEGEVSFISLTSETSNNGIVTYLVRIVIDDKGDSKIREGMTAFVDFVTAEAKDVLIIPVDAVSNVNDSPSVLSQDGQWLPVVTGFTDGDYVELISGLEVGDKIIY